MKRILSILVAFLAAPVLAASPVKESDLPDVLKKEPPFIQNQVCGELMASMARMSADLYAATEAPKMREAAIMAGTRAMVFVKATATLTKDEGARAKRIADQIEQGATPKKPSLAPYLFCEARAARWLKEGVVTPADYQQTEAEVRRALDAALKKTAKPVR
jgi:hypothetical protein